MILHLSHFCTCTKSIIYTYYLESSSSRRLLIYFVVLIVEFFDCYQETTSLQKITMIPGDGIGPEISQSVKDIFAAAGVSP